MSAAIAPAAGQGAVADNDQLFGQSETVEDPPVITSTPWDPYGTNFTGSLVLTAAFTLKYAPIIVMADGNTAGFTVTLPDPQEFEGKTITIQKMDATANPIAIATTSGTIYGGTTSITTQYTVRQYTAVNNATYVGWVGR